MMLVVCVDGECGDGGGGRWVCVAATPPKGIDNPANLVSTVTPLQLTFRLVEYLSP